MQVWITKYALTEGILKFDGEVAESSPRIVLCKCAYSTVYFHVEGRDWHRSPEAALTRAEAMRTAKIKSLHKSIKRIETMQFKVPT